MIKPSAAFNLTQIIESLEISASSVKENTYNSGVEGEHFSVALAAAMAHVREEFVGTEAAALSEVGKSLPLSISQQWNTKEQFVGNARSPAHLNLANVSEKIIAQSQAMSESHEEQVQGAGSEIQAELKLQTVRFLNGRKVLTSFVDLDNYPELLENTGGDFYAEKKDIDSNNTHGRQLKPLQYDSQLKSLPLWWENQKIQPTDTDMSLAGRMALAHSKQVNIDEVTNKEPIKTVRELKIKELKNQNDSFDPNISLLTEVMQKFQSFNQAASLTSHSNDKKHSLDLVANPVRATLNAVGSKDSLSLTEQQIAMLREYISMNLEKIDDASFKKDFEVFTNSSLGTQVIRNLAAFMNSTDIDDSASMNSKLGTEANQKHIDESFAQLQRTESNVQSAHFELESTAAYLREERFNSSIPAYNGSANSNSTDIDDSASMNNKLGTEANQKHIDESIAQLPRTESKVQSAHIELESTAAYLPEESSSGLIPDFNGSANSKSKSSDNGFKHAGHVGKPIAMISDVNNSQVFTTATEIGMTQHQAREVSSQAQSTQNSFYTQGMAKPQLGEQLMSIVAREIKIPEQDGVDLLRIEITPPDLGDLEIEIRKQGKDLEVSILASTDAAADTIKDHSSVLKNMLGNQEFSRVQVNVDISKREHSNQQGQGSTKEGNKEKQQEQRYVKIRIHDGVLDTFV